MTVPPFRRIREIEGYTPLEDYGLIGDGATAALVSLGGAIDWMCVPRYDSRPLFCRILDKRRGGAFIIAPEGLIEARQYYRDETGILVTEMRSSSGTVRLTDALTLRRGADLAEPLSAGRQELVRFVEVLSGEVTLRIELSPHGGADLERQGGALRIRARYHPNLDIRLRTTHPLGAMHSTIALRAGARCAWVLQWQKGVHRSPNLLDEAGTVLDATGTAWQQWVDRIVYVGPQAPLVRRSAITLKLLDHQESGAVVAAPTSSLPEVIGGERNWDYRYAWVRDAAFTVYAFRRIGLADEAWRFLAWVLDAVERTGHPSVMYDLDGNAVPRERIDDELEGYRRSWPVRWGNGASNQVQHDAYGEIVDCAYLWVTRGGDLDEDLWEQLRALVEAAARVWRQPDHGIWEVRTSGRPFTYSAALCQVAVDRGARLIERYALPGDVARWRRLAEEIRRTILTEAWNPDINALTEHLGPGGLDASLLSLPLRQVVPARHPKMKATCETIRERLGAGDGLLYRYLPDVSPDGLSGREGAFVLCSFWLVDNLTMQGRLDEAEELYDSLCARVNSVGLLPEEIDPGSGAFLGNLPQAFSHVGLISSGVSLAQAREAERHSRVAAV